MLVEALWHVPLSSLWSVASNSSARQKNITRLVSGPFRRESSPRATGRRWQRAAPLGGCFLEFTPLGRLVSGGGMIDRASRSSLLSASPLLLLVPCLLSVPPGGVAWHSARSVCGVKPVGSPTFPLPTMQFGKWPFPVPSLLSLLLAVAALSSTSLVSVPWTLAVHGLPCSRSP